MRRKDALGRTIVAVHQERIWSSQEHRFVWNVTALELDDGTLLHPSVAEMEGEYAIEFTSSIKPRKP